MEWIPSNLPVQVSNDNVFFQHKMLESGVASLEGKFETKNDYALVQLFLQLIYESAQKVDHTIHTLLIKPDGLIVIHLTNEIRRSPTDRDYVFSRLVTEIWKDCKLFVRKKNPIQIYHNDWFTVDINAHQYDALNAEAVEKFKNDQ